MKRDTQLEVMRRLLAAEERSDPVQVTRQILDAGRYRDGAELDRERNILFRRYPILLAHASELPESGAFKTVEMAGMPMVVARDGDTIRVFANACRHRGARLVNEPVGCGKAFTCRYHAWSYKLDGSLLHVPHRECFGPDFDDSRYSLVEIPSEIRHGFVWIRGEGDGPLDVPGFLGATIDEDFEAFDLADHVVLRTSVHQTRANWKLVMDAFAEGYHLSSLHRKSLARFFLEAAILDDCAPHVRQVGARKAIGEARSKPIEEWDFRRWTTPFYNLFPNSVLVVHPRWISHLALSPVAVDQVVVTHRMLVPKALAGDDDVRANLEESFGLIDGQVFAREDLAIAESVQSSITTGVVGEVVLGGLEGGMALFHAARDRALSS